MTAGRPTKYRTELCNKALRLMEKGYSKTFVAANLGINRDTLYEWCKEYPEFSDTIKKGEVLSEAFWEKTLRDAALGINKNCKESLLIFTMKARFKWKDRAPYEEDVFAKIEKEINNENDLFSESRISEIVNRYAPVMRIREQIRKHQAASNSS